MIPRAAVLLLATAICAGAQPKPAATGTGAPAADAPPDFSQFQLTDRELFAEAVEFLRQNNPARAIVPLNDLLRYHPASKLREETLYRVAACYKDLGRFDEAGKTLDRLAKDFPKSPWLSAADLLRGEMLAADKQWAEALPPLRRAATAAVGVDAKLRANYLVLLAYEHLEKPAAAKTALEFLVTRDQDNPYLDYARLRLAALDIAAGNNDRALSLLTAVTASAAAPVATRAEAAVHAGNLVYARGDFPAAIGFYDRARLADAPEFWRRLANLGLVQANFAAQNYAETVRVFNEVKPLFPDVARAQVMFLAAEAYRLTNQPAPALDLYRFVLEQFPGDIFAEPSCWARILLLRDLPGAEDDFLAETARFLAKFPNSPRLLRVQAMRADAYYARGDYKNAAAMYAAILENPDALGFPADALSGLYYRAATASFGLKDYKTALLWLTSYLAKFPADEATASVLWLKGLAESALNEPADALLSWRQLIDGYPKFPQRENVLWQGASLALAHNDNTRAAAWLEKLLAEFPQTARAAEAAARLATLLEAAGDDLGALARWIAARQADPARYYALATQHIILLLLKKQDVAQLVAETELYDKWRVKNPQDPALGLDVYEWLGEQLTAGPNPAAGEPYLRRVAAASKDAEQRRRVLLRLALLSTKLENWDAAVRDWSAYRVNFPEDANRSTVLEPLAQAFIRAGNIEAAHKLAEQILRQNPEGEFNARGRLLLGDIAAAKNNFEEAAKIYAAVALLIDHPQLTPTALSRAADAWRRAGNDEKANEALQRLKKQYPNYK